MKYATLEENGYTELEETSTSDITGKRFPVSCEYFIYICFDTSL